jgi:hypothetical protein
MITLLNGTREKSKLGSIVKQKSVSDGVFVYADGSEKGDVYIVAEDGVSHNHPCRLINKGEAKVLVYGSFKGGDVLRTRQSGDKQATGYAFKASDADVPYLKVGRALTEGRNGLIDVDLDIIYINELNSDGTAWEDLRAPATGINPAGSVAPPAVNTTDGSLTFSTSDAICVWFQLPHQWKEGTDLHLHIHWSKSTSASGTVNWQTKYKWANIGDTMPAFSSLVSGTVKISDDDTADQHALLEFPDISGTGKTISSMLCVYLIRTASGDTYGADANLYEVDVHYECNGIGSKTEYTK